MTLFFDRNMAKKMPDALRLLGLPVEKHDDYFGPRTTDEEWLEFVGKKGWCVVTSDTRLLWNRSQLKALADHGVACFILSGAGHRPRWYAVRIIARNWDHIEQSSETENRPFVHRLYLRGPVIRRQLSAR